MKSADRSSISTWMTCPSATLAKRVRSDRHVAGVLGGGELGLLGHARSSPGGSPSGPVMVTSTNGVSGDLGDTYGGLVWNSTVTVDPSSR